MSIYDYRDRPAYRFGPEDPDYCKNPYILKWWTSEHDKATARRIEKEQWVWSFGITDEILGITPQEVIEKWKLADPLCSHYAWYNVIMYFARARAEEMGLTKVIRKPKWKVCPLCGQNFVEDSLPYPLIKRLGIDQLDFCSPCLRDSVLNSGSDTLSRKTVRSYLCDLADVLGRVPPQNYGAGIQDLQGLTTEERLEILRVLGRKPTVHRVKELLGSWLEALIEAGILEGGTRRTSRGTQCIAKDGHICLSLGEKTIDDFLFSRGIPHATEPSYPEGNYRADFDVDGVLIEYFGLKGDPEYDSKTRLKQEICGKHSIELISVYPSDLMSAKKLGKKLLGSLGR